MSSANIRRIASAAAGYPVCMARSSTAPSDERFVVGGLFAMLAMLGSVAILVAIILLVLGDGTYAAAAAVLLGLLVVLAATDSTLARHQARRGTDENGVDGPFPVIAVDLRDPMSESEHEIEETGHVLVASGARAESGPAARSV
jgi:hypothetical protein